MHPVTPERPVGVLQCFNKRSRDAAFTDADLLTAKLICLYAAAAVTNASQFDSDYRCRLLSCRVAKLTRDIAAERDICELPGMITARAKELLGGQRSRLLFLRSPVFPGATVSDVDLQPVPNVVCSLFLNSAVQDLPVKPTAPWSTSLDSVADVTSTSNSMNPAP